MLKIYQVSTQIGLGGKKGWFEQRKDEFQALPIGTKLLVGAAGTVLAAGAVAIAAPIEIAAAAAGSVALAGSAINAWQSRANPVTIIDDPEELKKFMHHQGDELVSGAFYVDHPKRAMHLIPPSAFHETIAKEQMHEIVTFLRSVLPVTHVEVVMEDKKQAGAGGKARHKGLDDLEATFEHRRWLRVVGDYRNPVIIPLAPERPLIWRDKFNIIYDGVKGATGGSLTFNESVDMSLGFTLELANLVGVEANWLSMKSLTVNVEFGSV